MPTKTRMLDYGDFVHSPEFPAGDEFVEYLSHADRLFGQWQKAQAECYASPFSPELEGRKRDLDEELAAYTYPFRDKYTVGSTEQDPAFLHVSRFFAQYGPIQEPFSILHCDLDMPLHTVLEFPSYDDLPRVNAALEENTPLRWWRNGPMNRPCYLFGEWVWELKSSERDASHDGLALLFLEALEKGRQRVDRLKYALSTSTGALSAGVLTREPAPKEVRTLVWRRDRGRCAKCGSHEGLDFEHVIPVDKGGSNTAENIQLLCERCRRRQNDNL